MEMNRSAPIAKRMVFNPAAKRDWDNLPPAIQRSFGFGMRQVQNGHDPNMVLGSPEAKPLNTIALGVWELKSHDEAGTYRAIYTIKLEATVYVLHAFQKKSKKGIATTKADVNLIKARLQWAQADYAAKQIQVSGRTRGDR